MEYENKCAKCPKFGKGRCVSDEAIKEKAVKLMDALTEGAEGACDIVTALMVLGVASGYFIAMAGQREPEATLKLLERHMQDITNSINTANKGDDLPEATVVPPRGGMH